MRYLSTNAVTPSVLRNSATCFPSWSSARNPYPAPGQATTAVPLGLSARHTFGLGLSASESPTACGTLPAQSGTTGLAGCAATSDSRRGTVNMGNLAGDIFSGAPGRIIPSAAMVRNYL